jgi:hypothetical protein
MLGQGGLAEVGSTVKFGNREFAIDQGAQNYQPMLIAQLF